MGTLSWPKHDSGDAQREALKIFYDENNWLDNSVYISRLKAIIPGLGEEAYSKKIQIYTY